MASPKPHGGKLINTIITGKKREKIIDEAQEMHQMVIGPETLLDVSNIATGVFSPLKGFILNDDFDSIVKKKRLANGLLWTIPVTFPVKTFDMKIKEGDNIALYDYNKKLIALFHFQEKYTYNLDKMTKKVYGTSSLEHPGVHKAHTMGNIFLGGDVELINYPDHELKKHELSPQQTRELFKKMGWDTIAGFQTRNVPHRAHEYLQKTALEFVDGVFLHPLVGWKKNGDFKPEKIVDAYIALIRLYYPKNRALLSVLTTQMRYAGPNEAVFHAIIRKNFGCTHFIVGRDHAGVGKYYDKYGAHKIFDEFEDIGIEIMKLKGPFFCNHCGHIVTEKTCPHSEKEQIDISGTMIRKMVQEGRHLPKEIMRPEIAQILTKEDII